MDMLGARIAALRRSRGMSQSQLAQELGVSPSAIGMYEQGRREPSAATVVALSNLFQVSTDYLLTGKPNRAEEKVIAGLLQDRLENPPHRDSGLTPQELAVLLAAMLTSP
jgi:transcriptional regulator with XRE-family HTH domain